MSRPVETVPVAGPSAAQPEIPRLPVGEQPLASGTALRVERVFQGRLGEYSVSALVLPESFRSDAFSLAVGGSNDGTLPEMIARVHAPSARVALLTRLGAFDSLAFENQTAGPGTSSSGKARAWPDEVYDRDVVWVLEPAGSESPLFVDVAFRVLSRETGTAVRFPLTRGKEAVPERSGAQTEQLWRRALRAALREEARSPLLLSVGDRLRYLDEPKSGVAVSGEVRRNGEVAELSALMSLLSGRDSIDAALRADGSSRLEVGERVFAPKIPLEKVAAPRVPRQDFRKLLGNLRALRPVPELAGYVPSDFYFVHVESGEALFPVLDELGNYIYPAFQLLEQRAESSEILERSLNELGIERSELSRLIGPKLIESAAITGSDPFVRLGSDLTLVLRTKGEAAVAKKLLRLGLDGSLARVAATHGELRESSFPLGERQVVAHRSADGRVTRFLVEVDDAVILSNSRSALVEVVRAATHQRAALRDEPDFLYMWRRDQSVPYDVLAYFGDGFIERNVSPAKRILDARRGVAAAELRALGAAAVASGLLTGTFETAPERLLARKLVSASELQHFDGAKIGGTLGPESAWGRPERMTSLIELPPLGKVSEAEVAAYDAFRTAYEADWGKFLDPVALRFRLEPEGRGFNAALRVIPLVNSRELRSLSEFARGSAVLVETPGLGLSAVVAVGPDSELRREFSHTVASGFVPGLSLDWLGDYVFGGVEDDNRVAVAAYADVAPEPRFPRSEPPQARTLELVPLYAGVHLKNRSTFSVALALMLNHFRDAGSGVKVSEAGVEGESAVQRIELGGEKFFFSVGRDHFFVTTMRATMARLLEREKNGQLPKAAKVGGEQLVVESNHRPSGGLATVLSWLFETEARSPSATRYSNALADAQLLSLALGLTPGERLTPERVLPFLGSVPVTPDGAWFVTSEVGAMDPVRGNDLRRKYAKFPVAGSWAEVVLRDLSRVKIALSIDEEGKGPDGERIESLRSAITLRREER